MKFKDKYPDIELIHDDRDGIIRGMGGACRLCKEPTEYVEINYEAPFCSEECIFEFEEKLFGGSDES